MQKTCPECQKTFECSQSENCWCTRITIPEDVANYLRSKYFDCLCEECMTKILKNKEKGTSLQNWVLQFDSARYLNKKDIRLDVFFSLKHSCNFMYSF